MCHIYLSFNCKATLQKKKKIHIWKYICDKDYKTKGVGDTRVSCAMVERSTDGDSTLPFTTAWLKKSHTIQKNMSNIENCVPEKHSLLSG